MNRMTQTTPSLWRLIAVLALIALLTQFAVASAFAPHTLAAGTTCVVTPQGTGQHPTIQSAVNDRSCTTIRLVYGTYYENVTINRNVTILGLGPNLTTVNGGGAGSVFTNEYATVTLSGLTITNGSATDGGGIYNLGTLTITNSAISGNLASYMGGGIYSYRSTLTIINSTISDNAARFGGGINSRYGTVSLTNTQFANNTPDDCEGC